MFDGDVESLAVAEIEGVGIRVIADQRQGYAWAGSLDPDVIADTLADARDNAGFGSPDEFYGLADPADFAGVAAVELDLWRDELLKVPTADKVALAIELDAATRAIDPRVRGVGVVDLRRRRGRERGRHVARRRGVEPSHDVLVLRLRDGRRGRRDADRKRILGGADVRRARHREGRARRGRARGAAARRAAARFAPAARGARPPRHALVARV